LNNYFDEFGRLHDKPVTPENPVPSNNGWIYTAYFKVAGGVVNILKLANCFAQCLVNGKFVLRNPGQTLPPQSRDEILGAVELDLLKPEHLNGWSFSPYEIPRFNPIKLAKQLWQLQPTIELVAPYDPAKRYEYKLVFKHRNYFWQNNLDQIYRFAFSVPLTDRSFILKKWGKFHFYNPVHLFYAAFAKASSLIGKPNGIGYLKYGKSAQAMVQEFPKDHPIREKLGL
jgi:hypothetical protein